MSTHTRGQARGETTRTHILAAAAECFTRAGYDATGVADICEYAGVSKGAFYHHFPSKQAVFLALFEQWVQSIAGAIPAREQDGAPVTERLKGLAAQVERVQDAASGQVPMFLEFWRQAAKDPVVWQATIEPYRRYRSMFARLIQEGIDEGSLRAVDPDLTALVLVSLGVGLVLQAALEPATHDWARTAEAAVGLLLEGLAQ